MKRNDYSPRGGDYCPPQIEIIAVTPERGFATTGDTPAPWEDGGLDDVKNDWDAL